MPISTDGQQSVHASEARVTSQLLIRPARAEDLPDLNRVQQACYTPYFYEEPEVFATIVRHGMSFVAVTDGSVTGYALVHHIADPISPPELNTADGAVLDASSANDRLAKHVFIHDVSILVGEKHGLWFLTTDHEGCV